MIHGTKSHERLSTCHQDLQQLVLAASEDFDLVVLCGHRGKEEQDDAVKRGTSKLPWPKSRHNTLPSQAVDLAPWPIDWEDVRRFDLLGAHVRRVAQNLELTITWGGTWKTLVDRPHFEVVR